MIAPVQTKGTITPVHSTNTREKYVNLHGPFEYLKVQVMFRKSFCEPIVILLPAYQEDTPFPIDMP
jgi:hypothetical protein